MKRIPLALGLFSVRDSLRYDWKEMLKHVAAVGYEGVEFFGAMAYDPEELKKELAANGLTLVGWHIGIDSLDEANFDNTVAFCKAAGNPRLVVPGLPAEMTASADAWRKTAEVFCAAADKLAPHGISLGYHNHHTEFQALDGEIPWDIFVAGTEGKVFIQLDNGNAMNGNADVMELIRKYPRRGETVHLKPYSKKNGFDTMIGEDDVPWADFFAEIEAQGVTEWYVVEYECEGHYTQFGGVEACIAELKKMGK